MAKTKEERRNEIIETAGKLFEEKGYEQTQVQDIVNEIGVAKGLFYYYFKSKDEVMEELADRYADAIIDAVNKLISIYAPLTKSIVFFKFLLIRQKKSLAYLWES